MPDLRVSFPKPCDEPWDGMAPAGCDRICARCDTRIHDLQHYDAAGVEALLRRDPDACVRARIAADGVVALKPGRGRAARRVVAAIGATTLLATAAVAHPQSERRAEHAAERSGTIKGRLNYVGGKTVVVAVDATGRTYRANVAANGRYRLRHLPAGTYTITFEPACGDPWTLADSVTVTDTRVTLPLTVAKGGCIIIGKISVDDAHG